MMKHLTGLDGSSGLLARLLAILLVCAGLLPIAATSAMARGETAAQLQLVAQQTELARRIHGTRSARGMIVNDQLALQSIKLKPVQLGNGQYMLRAYDTTTGQFVKVSHPTIKAQLRGVMEHRFATAEGAATSAPSYKGHLTRTANSLEASYRGRLGGLQTQLNQVTAEIGTPVPEARTTGVKPVTETTPKPVAEGASGTSAAAKPSTVAEPTTGKPVVQSGTVVNEPTTTTKAPAEGVGAKTAASETAKPTTVAEPVPGAPVTRMGQLRSATAGAFKDSVKMIPLMLATGVGVDLYRQYKETGTLSLGQSISNVMSTQFIMAMGGAVGGGTLGSVAGTLLSSFAGPAAPFVKAALTIGGAAAGANFMGGQEIDWKRLVFTTAITAGVALLVPGGILGLAAVAGSGFGADWLYDKLFGKKKAKPATQASTGPWKAPTPIPVPLAGGNPNPPKPTPAPVAVQPPPQPPVQLAQPPPNMYPPLPPDKDPYADLRYTAK